EINADFCDAVSSIVLNLFFVVTTKLRATGLTHFCRTVSYYWKIQRNATCKSLSIIPLKRLPTTARE
ncbi:hypothetical protein, partial [Porphyromonas circumdentaria]|uniref:hypothetical protein n=1 Tax=Porphyromonas circumdentaria TaxID=29524 RepID=UPI0017A2E1AC